LSDRRETAEPESASAARLPPTTVTELYALYADELRCFLLGVLANLDLANEVLQITFAKTVERGHTARDESFKGWLFRVAYNEALTWKRRQQVRTKAAIRILAEGERVAESPEELVGRAEINEQVKEALAKLPADQQRIVRMRVYDDLTYAGIATELGVPLGTVYARMQQALKSLKNALE